MIEFLVNLGWDQGIATFVALALGVLVCATAGLLWVILGIWIERKFAGRVQDRLGPNRTGPFGLFQTFADVGKLLIKEDITPEGADRHVYNIAPLIAVGSVVLIWACIPFGATLIGADLNIGVLYISAVGSLATLGILLAGWGSNNKYALLGAFRVVAQLISYEIPMVLSTLIPVLLAGTMSMQGIVNGQGIAYVFVVPISALVFFISSLAEVGRSPFDLLEAESEIIAGFNIEYSGMKFAMFYAGEFLHAFTISILAAVLFLGGWKGPGADLPGLAGALIGIFYLFIKSMAVYFLVMLIRNTVPRLRIDHLMAFNWKFLVPLSLANLLVVAFLAGLFIPQYDATRSTLEANGLLALVESIFGAGFVAELPRAIALFLANVALFFVMNGLLRRYADDQRQKVADMVKERTPFTSPANPTTGNVPAGNVPASAGD
jgi:NADH-quinone oxidoreductase subunit H